jgi:hypothetical protein
MSVEQSEIIPGVFSRVMNFDWYYTDQSRKYIVFIISSKNVVSNDILEFVESVDPKFEAERIERISLISSLDINTGLFVFLGENKKQGEEIDFEY